MKAQQNPRCDAIAKAQNPDLRLSRFPVVWALTSIFCVLSIAGFVLMQRHLDQIRSPQEQLREKLIYIPEARFIKTGSLGFHAVLADVLWARAVIYFGGHFLTDRDYTWLYRILDAATALDPKNVLAYRFGGTLLALEKDKVEESIALLKKGIRHNPGEDWRLYFLLGFNYFHYLEDYDSAAEYLEKAARMPGHPEYLPRLAAKMYAKAEKIDTAIEFLRETYHQYDDQKVKSAIAERINVLVARKQIPSLEYAVGKYKEAYGEYPRELNALTCVGLIKELPVYSSGRYTIDPSTGRVDWISESIPHWP